MKKNILPIALIAVTVIAALLLLSSCSKHHNNTKAEKGFLVERISIGPLCPVERIPPVPRCQPTEETYKAWPIAVWTADKKNKIAQIAVAADGTFNVELSAGSYIVDIDKQQPGIGGRNLPATVTIKAGETTTLNVDIDTGIR